MAGVIGAGYYFRKFFGRLVPSPAERAAVVDAPRVSPVSDRPAGAASFRDPAGQLFRIGERLIRVIGAAGLDDFSAFSRSAAARAFGADGRLVSARVLSADERQALADVPGSRPRSAGQRP